MERFQWAAARTLEEAQEQVNATTSDVVTKRAKGKSSILKAGGVDLLDLMKEGLATPDKVISITSIPGMDRITYDAKNGLRMGALVTLSQMEEDGTIKEKYTALNESVSHAATPQVRNMATLGGNLAQRPRCWYFRSELHHCLKKGGNTCFAQEGQNEIHAIYDTAICPCVHSSSLSTALMAFGASVEILDKNGKTKMVKLSDFFTTPDVDVTRENILEPKEIITAVVIPNQPEGTKSFYIKQASRESYDWALADTAVVLQLSGDTCKKASIVLGAAAPVPIHATKAENALTGKTISETTAAEAGKLATAEATPLSHNAYKIPMFQSIVKKCILQTV